MTRVVCIALSIVYSSIRVYDMWSYIGYHSRHAPHANLQQSARTTTTALMIRNAAEMGDVMETSVNVVRGRFETRWRW